MSNNNKQIIFTNTVKDGSGDYFMPIVNSSGRLQVDIVSGGSTGGGGTSGFLDGAPFAVGSDYFGIAGGFYNDVAPSSVDEGDGGAFRMSSNRNIYTTIRDASGNERGVNVDSNNRLNVITDINYGSSVVILANTVKDGSGTNYVPLVDSNGRLQVDVNNIGSSVVMLANTVKDGSGDSYIPLVNSSGRLIVDVNSGPSVVMLANTVKDGSGDSYIPLVDSNGRLQVDVISGGGGTQYTLGTDTYTEATTIGTMAGTVRSDTISSKVNTNNELAPLQVDKDGALYIRDHNSTTSTLNTSILNVGGTTTLGASILTTGATGLSLISSSQFSAGQTVLIDSEYIILVTATGSTITREQFGSTATTHEIGANVTGVYVGTYETNSKPDVMTSTKSSTNGTLFYDFSNDGVSTDTFPVAGFAVAANIHEFHNAVKGNRYYRARFINGSSLQTTYFRNYTYFGQYRQGNLPLNQSISDDSDATLTRSVLVGKTDGGIYLNTPVSQEGHLEVEVHGPLNPFGSIHTESITALFQATATYILNDGLISYSGTSSGTVVVDDGMFVCSTGVSVGSQAVLQSKKRVIYRPGQGIIGMFTAIFPEGPVDNSYRIIGLGHSEDGIYFGYRDLTAFGNPNSEFGILYVNRGKRQIMTLTITSGATTTDGNATITLNSKDFTVPVTNSTLQRNVWEIATFTYTGWKASPVGATVVFISDAAAALPGTYSVANSTSVALAGTFATTRTGKSAYPATETFIPQSTWNGDVMDGTGSTSNPSGVLADWTKGNVFKIGIQFLGYGPLTLSVEANNNSNNPNFVNVHTIRIPNTLTATTFRNPSLPFTMAAYSITSTTDISVKCASFGGFIEGDIHFTGNRFSYSRTLVNVASTGYTAFYTIYNELYFGGIPNQGVINLLDMAVSVYDSGGSASATNTYIIKNGSLVGSPSFANYSTTSISNYDIAATSVTFSDNAQLLFSLPMSVANSQIFTFEDLISIQPGEWITIAATGVAAAVTSVSISVNTREDR